MLGYLVERTQRWALSQDKAIESWHCGHRYHDAKNRGERRTWAILVNDPAQ